jgi:hypothetical protein
MMIAMAAKATAKGIDNNIIINKKCTFRYKQATYIISMDDLKFLSIKKSFFNQQWQL